jgi:DNA helicase TIP49 (TBP-interacting protein)
MKKVQKNSKKVLTNAKSFCYNGFRKIEQRGGVTVFVYGNLISKMKERGVTQGDIAIVLDKSPGTVSAKFKGKSTFDQQEIIKIADFLDIPRGEIPEYFFCKSSSENLNKVRCE